MFIDGNIANNYVARDVEESHGDGLEDHPVTDYEIQNTGTLNTAKDSGIRLPAQGHKSGQRSKSHTYCEQYNQLLGCDN